MKVGYRHERGRMHWLAAVVCVSLAASAAAYSAEPVWADEVSVVPSEENEPRIREAVEVARQADRIVLVIGDTEQTSREGWAPNHLGDRASLELVGDQLELADALTRPVLELKGFRRVSLEPGETKTVTLRLTPDALSFWDINMSRIVEPGDFDILVGPDSVRLKSAVLTVRAK